MESPSTKVAAASVVVAILATVALGAPRSEGRFVATVAATEPDVRIPTPEAPLAINAASAAAIEALPGVGPRLAARLVAERDRLGGFRGEADLDAVSGVGPSLLRKLRPLVRFDRVPAIQNRSTRNPMRNAREIAIRDRSTMLEGP